MYIVNTGWLCMYVMVTEGEDETITHVWVSSTLSDGHCNHTHKTLGFHNCVQINFTIYGEEFMCIHHFLHSGLEAWLL